MNIDRFTELLDAYGADLELWPAAERRAAATFLAGSDEARRQQRAAEAFDRLLLNAALPEIEPSDALRSRIFARIQPPVQAAPRRSQIMEALALLFPTGRMVPQFAALALALAIGISAGFTDFADFDTQDDIVTLQLAAATPVTLED